MGDCFLGVRNRINVAEVEQLFHSPVLVMHGRVTKPIFCPLLPANGVDFPGCEVVVKMILKESVAILAQEVFLLK